MSAELFWCHQIMSCISLRKKRLHLGLISTSQKKWKKLKKKIIKMILPGIRQSSRYKIKCQQLLMERESKQGNLQFPKFNPKVIQKMVCYNWSLITFNFFSKFQWEASVPFIKVNIKVFRLLSRKYSILM